jgi:hypothetical protein
MMMRSKLAKVAATAAISGALSLSAMGLVTGTANAAPYPDTPWAQDRGHGHGHDNWYGDDRGRWNGPGVRYWDPVQACIVISGPFGYVQGSACI